MATPMRQTPTMPATQVLASHFRRQLAPSPDFAEIDRRELALGLGQFAKENGGESAAGDRHEGLAMLSSREAVAALKQSVFPPSTGRRPARLYWRAA